MYKMPTLNKMTPSSQNILILDFSLKRGATCSFLLPKDVHLDTSSDMSIQINSIYSKAVQRSRQTSFCPSSPVFTTLFCSLWVKDSLLSAHSLSSNLYLFFFPQTTKMLFSCPELFWRASEAGGINPGWFQVGYFLLPSLHITKLPKSRTSANCLHWPKRNGSVSERTVKDGGRAAGKALLGKDSSNHTT